MTTSHCPSPFLFTIIYRLGIFHIMFHLLPSPPISSLYPVTPTKENLKKNQKLKKNIKKFKKIKTSKQTKISLLFHCLCLSSTSSFVLMALGSEVCHIIHALSSQLVPFLSKNFMLLFIAAHFGFVTCM